MRGDGGGKERRIFVSCVLSPSSFFPYVVLLNSSSPLRHLASFMFHSPLPSGPPALPSSSPPSAFVQILGVITMVEDDDDT